MHICRSLARAMIAGVMFVGACSAVACVGRSSADLRLGALPRGVASADLNLLLVTLDTTRADRLGAYGAPSQPTPAFDRVARDGVLFRHAVTAIQLTLPSPATMFTARYPPPPAPHDQHPLLPAPPPHHH